MTSVDTPSPKPFGRDDPITDHEKSLEINKLPGNYEES